MSEYQEIVEKEWEKYSKAQHLPNIMLLGCTGCGKSTLINTIFGKQVAKVSDTGRGTTEFQVYRGEDNNSSVNLIDSKGYEMGSAEDCKRFIGDFNKWMSQNRNTQDMVHLVWYCISVSTTRIQDYDIEVLKSVNSDRDIRGKLAVVITQCDNDDEQGTIAKSIRDIVHEDVGSNIAVFEVSNDPKLPLDIEKLIEWSSEHIDDEDIRKMFVAAQMVNLEAKRKTAAKIIAAAVTAAAATGAIPIPGPDAPILTAEQVAMTAAVIGCYGMNMAKGVITALVGDVLISNLGKTLVGSIVKLIPGVGTVVGAAINGSVAAAITGALGAAVSEICYNCCKRIAQGKSVDLIAELDYNSIKGIMGSFLKKNGKKSPEEIEIIIESDGEEKNI